MTLEHRGDENFETVEQPLYIVMGGEVTDPRGTQFVHPEQLDVIGIFADYNNAFNAWRAAAQKTVDDAFMKYMVVRLR